MLQQNIKCRYQEPCLTSGTISVLQVLIREEPEDDRSILVSAVLPEWASVFRTQQLQDISKLCRRRSTSRHKFSAHMQVCKLSVLHDLLGTGNDFSCLCVWKCWSGETCALTPNTQM
jgi:hypothetical protein